MPRLRACPGGPLGGTLELPGDKSQSHRALILGALAEGTTEIRGLLDSADVQATARALDAFGIRVEPTQEACRVTGGEWQSPAVPIDCGNSGTAARLLMGAAAGFAIEATFTGDDSLRRRPMDRVIRPLARMGARFDGGDRLPVRLAGGGLGGIDFRNQFASAQIKSAILIAGLRSRGPVRVVEPLPSRDHSEIMLAEFGCELHVADGPHGRTVELGERRALAACTVDIARDPSSASFLWLAAAIVPGSEIRTPSVLVNPLRTGFLKALEEMGAEVELANERVQSGEVVADVTVRHSALQGVQVGAERIPAMIDEVPALAVAAAFADGETLIEGLAELRHKESDRLGAIVAGLAACGVAAAADGDSLRVFGRGGARGGAEVASQGDHRIAMAFTTLGLAASDPVVVDGAEMIATSFPAFVETMRAAGAEIDELD